MHMVNHGPYNISPIPIGYNYFNHLNYYIYILYVYYYPIIPVNHAFLIEKESKIKIMFILKTV